MRDERNDLEQELVMGHVVSAARAHVAWPRLLIATALSAGLAMSFSANTALAQVPNAVQAHYAQLEDRLQRAVKKNSASEEADALYDIAIAHYNNKDYTAALAFIDQSIAAEDRLHRAEQSIQSRQIKAIMLHASGNDAAAINEYNDAFTRAQAAGFNNKAVDIMLCIGQLSLNTKKLDDARSSFEKALALSSAKALTDSETKVLSNLGVVAQLQGKSSDAIDYFKRAVELLARSQDPSPTAKVLIQLGTAYADAGMPYESLAAFQKAAKQAESDGDPDVQAKALWRAGDTSLSLQRPGDAIDYLTRAKQLAADDNSSLQLDLTISLGSAHADAGELVDAKKEHDEAVSRASQLHDSKRELLAMTEAAYDDFLSGSLEKALGGFFGAYQFLTENFPQDDSDKASLLGYLGMCYDGLGQTYPAVKFDTESAELYRKLGRSTDEALAYNSVASAYLDHGDFARFEQFSNKAKDVLSSAKGTESKDRVASAYLEYNSAQALVCQGKFKEAIAAYQNALASCRQEHDARGEGRILRGLGLAYLMNGDADSAIDAYQKCLANPESSANVETQWDCAVGLGKAFRARGDLKAAEQQFRNAVALVEKERRQMSRDTFKTFNLDWRQDCFTELADILVNSGRYDEALEIAEKGRARAFLDLLGGRTGGHVTPKSVGKVVAEPGGEDRRLSLSDLKNGTGEGATRDVQVLARPRATVDVSALSPVTANPPSLEELRSLIQTSKSYYVEYFVMPKKTLVWVLSPEAKVISCTALPIDRQQLTDKIQNALLSITSSAHSMSELAAADKQRDSNLRDLYKLLIEPVSASLPAAPDAMITIVPHGPIFQVPFTALLSPKNKFFIEDHSLSYLPAIAVLRATGSMEKAVDASANTLLAFGNPITNATAFLGKLPYAEKEVRAVAALFPPGASAVEVADKATKSEFCKLAPEKTLIHLATHGLVDEVHPMDSALVLAPEGQDDGLLTVRDILQLPPLKSKLIVLSACQTGRGQITGDGVVGLSRAFIIAGTPSIMVSQWNVDDVMTEFQMKQFYTNFLKGVGKATALRNAQLETISFMEKTLSSGGNGGEPTRANPRYWGAFQLVGDYK